MTGGQSHPRPGGPTLTAEKLLKDGAWHHREELIRLLLDRVEPARAHREEVRRRSRYGYRLTSTDEALVAAGKRYIAGRDIRDMVRRGWLEVSGIGSDRQYRIKTKNTSPAGGINGKTDQGEGTG